MNTLTSQSKSDSSTILIQFWGVRGTLAVPGINTNRYGGNTNCITLRFPNNELFIFDAGTGIKELSNYILKHNHFPLHAKIFITHPHYDHINGMPFFVPLYMSGNHFEILGTDSSEMTLEKLISGQMDGIYFPVTTKEFAAQIKYTSLDEGSFDIDGIHVETMLLNHPGRCMGFRINYSKKSFCYITDNELYLENSPEYNQSYVDKLLQFIKNADVLVMDSTYKDSEYGKKVGWGHSCISRVVDIADKAKAKLLCLYHHDPDQLDSDIDEKVTQAQKLLSARNSTTQCIAPKEGEELTI